MAKTPTKKATGKGKETKGGNAKSPATKFDTFNIPETMDVRVGDHSMVAMGKEFKTGSVGYHSAGKILVGPDNVKCQVNILITVVGSKDK